jgi:hypothetical protein
MCEAVLGFSEKHGRTGTGGVIDIHGLIAT